MNAPYRPEPCPKCAKLEEQIGALTEELAKQKNPPLQLPKQPWWRMFWRTTPRLPKPAFEDRIGRVWVAGEHTFMVFDSVTYARVTCPDWRMYASIAGEKWVNVETGLTVEDPNLRQRLGRAIVHHDNVGHAAKLSAKLKRLGGLGV